MRCDPNAPSLSANMKFGFAAVAHPSTAVVGGKPVEGRVELDRVEQLW
jgi:hypothetical protein